MSIETLTTQTPNPESPIGSPRQRIEGALKVTGGVVYTSDHDFPGLLFAVPVGATIANGQIESIDMSVAEKIPGVHAIYHHGNFPKIYRLAPDPTISLYCEEQRPVFEDEFVRYYGQYVAVVIADTLEQATAAADRVGVTYREEEPNLALRLELVGNPQFVSQRGDEHKAFQGSPIQLDVEYRTSPMTHNAIEPHATVAVWDGQNYTLYETVQGVINHRNVMMQRLGVPAENLRVIMKYLGSGFGGKATGWSHCALAATSARLLNRPVKLVLTRRQCFETTGHRAQTQQRIRIGAIHEGRLVSLRQDFINHTSMLDDFREPCGEATPYIYSVPNLLVTSGLARRNIGAAAAMRGPGAVPGLFATESAMDELAVKLGIDRSDMGPGDCRVANEPRCHCH